MPLISPRGVRSASDHHAHEHASLAIVHLQRASSVSSGVRRDVLSRLDHGSWMSSVEGQLSTRANGTDRSVPRPVRQGLPEVRRKWTYIRSSRIEAFGRTNRAPTPAVVLTMYDDDVTVPAALGRGAYGYTLKEPDRTTSSPPYG